MTLILLIVIVGAACVLAGVLILAAWQLWVDHEAAKQEDEATRRRMLETAHRTPAPFHEKAAQGGAWKVGRRVS